MVNKLLYSMLLRRHATAWSSKVTSLFEIQDPHPLIDDAIPFGEETSANSGKLP